MKNLLIKAIELAIERLENNLDIEKQMDCGSDTIANFMWEIKKYEELKIYLEKLSSINSLSFHNQGGSWLGTVRNWIQRKAYNGESVTWGSQEYLKLKELTVSDLELLATEIAAATTKEILNHKLSFIND